MLNQSLSQCNSIGGNIVLRIPGALMIDILLGNQFGGIVPPPRPKKNPDGSYCVILSPEAYQIFKYNQDPDGPAPPPMVPVVEQKPPSMAFNPSRH